MTTSETTRKRKPRCPICGRPMVKRFMPFCSRRCADADLARWLDGKYVIPGEEPADAKSEDGPD
ncbi:MAG: DNA gyrase inhibitor YacG [Alphaproteobacteria bacterium]